MAGVDLLEMPADQAVATVYTLYVDDLCSAYATRSEVRGKVDSTLREEAANLASWMAYRRGTRPTAAPTVEELTGPGGLYDKATWGLLPEHQAGLRRAIEMVGGEAG